MIFKSTRGAEEATSAKAIAQGLAKDGGLFVPEHFAQISQKELLELSDKDYNEQAKVILQKYLTEYTNDEISQCVDEAYSKGTFPDGQVVYKKVTEKISVLELWHGPTSAFKDMALQLLPKLLTKAIEKTGEKKEVVILVATSGDTGKAALEGFCDVAGTKIVVFYPQDGVSQIQKLQMITQKGDNVSVFAIKGNFDDAQTGVKKLFSDKDMIATMQNKGYVFSSANSINWGRLVPQIIYYFNAYFSAVQNKTIAFGDKVNFAVPTGNFGNILAGYYAKCMGLPINKFICASNSNNVLADFIKTGVYNRNRPFHQTISPSMDILVSSNLERLLYHLTDGDSKQVASWMQDLNEQGCYDIGQECKKSLQENFVGYWIDDEQTKKTIKEVFEKTGCLLDTHTAVAWFAANCHDGLEHTIVVSTASPFKFAIDVLSAVQPNATTEPFEALQELAKISKLNIPPKMQELENLPKLHNQTIDAGQMKQTLEQILKI